MTSPTSITADAAGPSAPADFDELNHSIPLPWDRISLAPAWNAAMEALLARLEVTEERQRARKAGDRARLLATMSAMVAALYSVHARDPLRWLAYSRDANAYGPSQRYVHPSATAKLASQVADFLARERLVEHRRGFYRRRQMAGGQGFRSRIRATGALVAFLSDRFGLSADSIILSPNAETIILKASAEDYFGAKRLLPYEDTEETCKMRAGLARLNAHLQGFRIDLEGDLSGPQGDDEDDLLPNSRQARLYRVFNNGRWDHGGRFYGGWWQRLPKADRKRLLIDGEEVIELDFKALHPRLCYHLSGKPLGAEVDPYALPDLAGEGIRPIVKIAFNQLLNMTTPGCPKAPPGAARLLPKGVVYRDLIDRIEQNHKPIGAWFRQGRGLALQRIDSDIVERVTGYLIHRGICCLPVHDSFIVPRSAEFVLGQTMALAYRGALSLHTDVRALPVITGWSSPAMEQRAMSPLIQASMEGECQEGAAPRVRTVERQGEDL